MLMSSVKETVECTLGSAYIFMYASMSVCALLTCAEWVGPRRDPIGNPSLAVRLANCDKLEHYIGKNCTYFSPLMYWIISESREGKDWWSISVTDIVVLHNRLSCSN